MHKSESIASLAKALAVAQGQMGGAKKGSANPFFKSTYSDLSSVVAAIRDPLSSNGLSFVQATEPSDHNEIRVITLLMHESGEWIESTIAIPVSKADAQGYGSAITYAKRYGLQALLGIPSEDDDGNAAAKAAPPERPKSVAKLDFSALPPDEQQFLRDLAVDVLSCESDEAMFDAYVKTTATLDSDEKVAFWSLFDSKQRNTITRLGKQAREAREAA